MSGRLAGRVAVITGGASGIGAGTARRFHAEGARVVIADLQDGPGAALAGELGDGALFRRTDVTREEDVAALVDAAVERFGALDIMFNNAGVMGALGPIDRTRLADADLTIAINLRGVLCGMKHAARVMKPRRSGVIISTSSPAGVLGGVGPHVYSGVKAGIIGLSRSVAAELRRFGVRCNVLVPGAVVSPMTAELVAGGAADLGGAGAALSGTAYMDRPLHPEDVAAGALYLASDDASFVTGIVLPVDAGMTGAGGPSPFTTGRYEEPVGLLEAGRRTEGRD
ncbi:SDR family oxidoreductase [Actinomadura madurae]|uniref:SDR family oxidoreductase n=1 Tax=Actinomadura madurae TaxID=1993 RepID=UPI00202721A8|nr:SDR family oxidoreductase [Actinomadura madurae]MCP9948211.1 SDR family oxidoreductase [Actinomadura madurae]MCP9964981.1 SDR family oxidoreductase [Actinomadura madurae]MCP9977473.1 SDR family oxidoreductase [Actinomadura madurae]URN04597.1 SDR family oxidoreductase [Actinomadura madurae]